MRQYDVTDWYWLVGADATRVWSSARAKYVPVSDDAYVAWRDAGGIATPIPTEAELADVFAAQFPAGYKTPASVRYEHEIAGVMFKASGSAAASLFATDREAQAKINASFAMATAGHWVDGAPWKAADGTFVPMTTADIEGLAVKAATYVATCFAYEAQLTAALATNPATDITQGWPSNA